MNEQVAQWYTQEEYGGISRYAMAVGDLGGPGNGIYESVPHNQSTSGLSEKRKNLVFYPLL